MMSRPVVGRVYDTEAFVDERYQVQVLRHCVNRPPFLFCSILSGPLKGKETAFLPEELHERSVVDQLADLTETRDSLRR